MTRKLPIIGEIWRIGQGCRVRVLRHESGGYACVSIRNKRFHLVRPQQFRARVK